MTATSFSGTEARMSSGSMAHVVWMVMAKLIDCTESQRHALLQSGTSLGFEGSGSGGTGNHVFELVGIGDLFGELAAVFCLPFGVSRTLIETAD